MPKRTRPENRKIAKKLLLSLLVLLFWLAVWQIAAQLVDKEIYLPRPALVLQRFGTLLLTADFWHVTATSLKRIVSGFLLGLGGGAALAVLTHLSRLADRLISPLIKAILATPVASFIIITIIWFSSNAVPTFIVFLIVTPVFWRNVHGGISATDPQLLEMAALYRLSAGRKALRIYIPSVMPHFLAACSTALGLAWKSGIAAEVISQPKMAIGSQLQAGKIYLETADVFVWTMVVIILSLLIERLLVSALRRLGQRYNVQEGPV